MWCVLPFCAADRSRLIELLEWMNDLGGCHGHKAVLVYDPATSSVPVLEPARKVFDTVESLQLDQPVTGWPDGANALWDLASRWMEKNGGPWLWLEPDAIPLKAGWLDMIQAAYYGSGRPFMGAVTDGIRRSTGLPMKNLNGVAVYPMECRHYMPTILKMEAFDLSWVSQVLPHTANSPLFQCIWGKFDQAPTFQTIGEPGTNRMDLSALRPEAVLFHRNKDGSLIRFLRGIVPSNSIMLVFPFCNHDARTMLSLIQWIGELNPRLNTDALLTYDSTTFKSHVQSIRDVARRIFKTVTEFSYAPPPPGRFPASVAFFATALFIRDHFKSSWFWMESDCVPLCSGWLETLQTEYQNGGLPFAGTKVPQMGHFNGTAIYPPDAVDRLRYARSHQETAWDTAAKTEMTGQTTDLSHRIFHVWVMAHGRFHPYGSGQLPSFRDPAMLAQIPSTAVLFHRCKDGSLITALRSKLRHAR